MLFLMLTNIVVVITVMIPGSSLKSEFLAGGCVSQMQSDPPSPVSHNSLQTPAIMRNMFR